MPDATPEINMDLLMYMLSGMGAGMVPGNQGLQNVAQMTQQFQTAKSYQEQRSNFIKQLAEMFSGLSKDSKMTVGSEGFNIKATPEDAAKLFNVGPLTLKPGTLGGGGEAVNAVRNQIRTEAGLPAMSNVPSPTPSPETPLPEETWVRGYNPFQVAY